MTASIDAKIGRGRIFSCYKLSSFFMDDLFLLLCGSVHEDFTSGKLSNVNSKDATLLCLLVSITKGGNTCYYQYNAHGDVVSLTNNLGQVVNTYTYDPWGKVLSASEQVANPYRYAGYRYDSSTGLYYLQARYYKPDIHRFVSTDPYPGDLRNPQTLNRYAYAANNPVNWTDPSGLGPKDRTYGFPKEFWNWYHRNRKAPGDRDLTRDEAQDYFDEWKGLGKPGSDKKGRRAKCAPNAKTEVVRAVEVGAGAAVGGYLVYRAVRMVPSLFPPLWPTIPANLAIP